MIDLQKLSGEFRKDMVELGLRFASEDVLKQGAQTLKQYERSEKVLSLYGYGDKQAETLRWLCARLKEEVSRRDARVVGNRDLRDVAALSEQKGKKARLMARSLLQSARQQLWLEGDEQAARAVKNVLSQTTQSQDDADLLQRQLMLLRNSFEGAVVRILEAAAVKNVLTEVELAIQRLEEVHASRPRRMGTPYSSELLNLLDGLIIENVRTARHAAHAAARALGRPHLLKAFSLLELYGRPAKRTSGAANLGNSGGLDDAEDLSDAEENDFGLDDELEGDFDKD